jgi:hypothetical protein
MSSAIAYYHVQLDIRNYPDIHKEIVFTDEEKLELASVQNNERSIRFDQLPPRIQGLMLERLGATPVEVWPEFVKDVPGLRDAVRGADRDPVVGSIDL